VPRRHVRRLLRSQQRHNERLRYGNERAALRLRAAQESTQVLHLQAALDYCVRHHCEDLHLHTAQTLAPGHVHGSGPVGSSSLSPHNARALELLVLHRDAASQLKRQLKLGHPCVGHSCFPHCSSASSSDESKRCTQHPKLAALLAALSREQEHFAFSFWCHDPAEWEYTYGTASPHPPEHWSEDFWPSWAAHPSKFCGSHDVDDVVAFKVLHRGEWVYPDDVDLD
jgi:hypothetical protein